MLRGGECRGDFVPVMAEREKDDAEDSYGSAFDQRGPVL
jgi:hypothetical protein